MADSIKNFAHRWAQRPPRKTKIHAITTDQFVLEEAAPTQKRVGRFSWQ